MEQQEIEKSAVVEFLSNRDDLYSQEQKFEQSRWLSANTKYIIEELDSFVRITKTRSGTSLSFRKLNIDAKILFRVNVRDE